MCHRGFSEDPENSEKTRQNAENKQTLDLSGKIEIEGKTRQNAENKQTLGILLLIFYILFASSHPQFP